MPTSSLPIFSKMASPGARVQDPVLCKVKFKWTHLHGQIQMSAAWGKICGQIPQREDNRSHSNAVPLPVPPAPAPLRLNIDTCITISNLNEER